MEEMGLNKKSEKEKEGNINCNSEVGTRQSWISPSAQQHAEIPPQEHQRTTGTTRDEPTRPAPQHHRSPRNKSARRNGHKTHQEEYRVPAGRNRRIGGAR
jgi:hypothetical protein